MQLLIKLILALLIWYCHPTQAELAKPVYIGLDAEFNYQGSTSAEAIEKGILLAVDEINRAGGVLNGRPLELMKRANHSVPARSIVNIEELAANPDVVAVFCGRFSPTVLDSLATIHRVKLPMLDPWAAADGIIDNHYQPNYVFRLSLKDSWAVQTMIPYAGIKKAHDLGLLLLNTSWGRSNLDAAEKYIKQHPEYRIVASHWFNWNEESLLEKYLTLYQSGAQAIIFVGNSSDAVKLIQAQMTLPAIQRVPVISHWGITGGNLVQLAGKSLYDVDWSVVQTYSFIGKQDLTTKNVIAGIHRLFGISDIRQLESPVGVAHAYDLTHILAKAINAAGSVDRGKIRDALEKIKNHKGLIKNYVQVFTPTRHDALSATDVFMAKYASDGSIEPIPLANKKP